MTVPIGHTQEALTHVPRPHDLLHIPQWFLLLERSTQLPAHTAPSHGASAGASRLASAPVSAPESKHLGSLQQPQTAVHDCPQGGGAAQPTLEQSIPPSLIGVDPEPHAATSANDTITSAPGRNPMGTGCHQPKATAYPVGMPGETCPCSIDASDFGPQSDERFETVEQGQSFFVFRCRLCSRLFLSILIAKGHGSYSETCAFSEMELALLREIGDGEAKYDWLERRHP